MFYSDSFDKNDNNFTFMLTIIVPVFDLGMSFGKLESGKSLQIYVQNCVGTLRLGYSTKRERFATGTVLVRKFLQSGPHEGCLGAACGPQSSGLEPLV